MDVVCHGWAHSHPPFSSALRTLTSRGLGSDNPACRPNATRSVPPLLKMKSTCPEHTVLSGFNLAYSGRFPPKCLTIKLKDVRIHWGNGHVLARAVMPTGSRARLMVNGLGTDFGSSDQKQFPSDQDADSVASSSDCTPRSCLTQSRHDAPA